jgi:hypothetical protein
MVVCNAYPWIDSTWLATAVQGESYREYVAGKKDELGRDLQLDSGRE